MIGREPFAVVVSRPQGMSDEGWQWASESMRRHADTLGLDVSELALLTPANAARVTRDWPIGGAR